jgi:hypothetical protein
MSITTITRTKIAAYGSLIQILLLLLVFSSCEWGTPDYRLNVIIEEGVTGTPQAGEHMHKELTDVSFEYTPIDPRHTLEVFINSIRQGASGGFTMFTDATLIAQLVDIRGSWNMQMRYEGSAEVDYDFTITFEGAGLTSGTFSDDRGNSGLWAAENGTVTISYTDWNFSILVGSVFDMSGTFIGDERNGVWNATRL